MKKLLVLVLVLALVLTFVPILTKAQTGFEPQLKVSYELGIDEDKNQSFGAEFVAAYRLSEELRLGIGVGIYWCKHLYEDAGVDALLHQYYDEYRETASYIPVFLNGKYNFVTKRNWMPYLSLDAGYSFFNAASDYAKDNDLGLFVKPAFGVDYNIDKGALFLEVGYKYQDRKFQDAKMGYSQLTLSIGYQF